MSWSERHRRTTLGPRFRGDDEPACRSTFARLVVGLGLSGVLVACGFHLRGDVSYAFPTVYVRSAAPQPIVLELRRAIDAGSGTRTVETAKDATVTLELSTVADDKTVLSLSSGGRAREYQLTKRVTFNLRDADGREWLPAGEIVIRRSFTFNESEVLAREAEEARLLREMQTDVVQQVVRRLQAARKPV